MREGGQERIRGWDKQEDRTRKDLRAVLRKVTISLSLNFFNCKIINNSAFLKKAQALRLTLLPLNYRISLASLNLFLM